MQTKTQSLIEQTCNIGSGFLLATGVWHYAVRPLIQHDVLSIDNTLTITLIFTITSFIRGYIWRRLFNKLTQNMSNVKI